MFADTNRLFHNESVFRTFPLSNRSSVQYANKLQFEYNRQTVRSLSKLTAYRYRAYNHNHLHLCDHNSYIKPLFDAAWPESLKKRH
jgi:hypothetical protein